MKINKLALTFIASTVVLTGCASTDEKDASLLDTDVKTAQEALITSGLNNNAVSGEQFMTQGLSQSELNANAMNNGVSSLGAEFSDPANPLSKQTIYFKHDSSQIQQDFISVIAAHAQYLATNPGQRVILEGHTDELGSREYNIALGEQRAKSVFSILRSQGVTGQQLEVVSYGEEKPASEGVGEASWQLNRRVEITYQVQ